MIFVSFCCLLCCISFLTTAINPVADTLRLSLTRSNYDDALLSKEGPTTTTSTTTGGTSTSIIQDAIVEKDEEKNQATKQQQKKKFLSLPLIPHHVESKRNRKIRRQQERNRHKGIVERVGEEEGNDDEETIVSAVHVSSLYQGYGTHYVDLWCGSPKPQRQTVIVDTGSSVTAFPCDGCVNCGETVYHIDDLYREQLSSSFLKSTCSTTTVGGEQGGGGCLRGHCYAEEDICQLGMSYTEGSSWTAFEATDLCYVGGPHGSPLPIPMNENDDSSSNTNIDNDLDPMQASALAFDLNFGCQTKLTGLFKTQLADGIMGMDKANESFWKQMFVAGKLPEEIFGLCYTRSPTVDRDGIQAGALSLGGVDTRLHKTPMVYTKDTTSLSPYASVSSSDSVFYNVGLRKLYLRQGGGGDSIQSTDSSLSIVPVDIAETQLMQDRTIVDSGTTDTYFSRKYQHAIHDAWQGITKGIEFSQDPVILSKEQLNNYPTLIIQLQGDEERNQQIVGDGHTASSIIGLAGVLDPDHPYDVLIAVPPSHYMEYDDDVQVYVNRIYADEARGNVIGANTMMGHDIVFDVKQRAIGWAESDCDYAALLSEYGGDEVKHSTGTADVDNTATYDISQEIGEEIEDEDQQQLEDEVQQQQQEEEEQQQEEEEEEQQQLQGDAGNGDDATYDAADEEEQKLQLDNGYGNGATYDAGDEEEDQQNGASYHVSDEEEKGYSVGNMYDAVNKKNAYWIGPIAVLFVLLTCCCCKMIKSKQQKEAVFQSIAQRPELELQEVFQEEFVLADESLGPQQQEQEQQQQQQQQPQPQQRTTQQTNRNVPVVTASAVPITTAHYERTAVTGAGTSRRSGNDAYGTPAERLAELERMKPLLTEKEYLDKRNEILATV